MPNHLRKQLVWWVGGTAVWVYTMVVLGGATRLTRSGLSMTDWKFTGVGVFCGYDACVCACVCMCVFVCVCVCVCV